MTNPTLRDVAEALVAMHSPRKDPNECPACWRRWDDDSGNPCVTHMARLALAAEPAGTGWIPCSERLPEIGARVLALDGREPVICWRSPSHGGAWRGLGRGILPLAPTHWRPLPPPPSVEGARTDPDESKNPVNSPRVPQ